MNSKLNFPLIYCNGDSYSDLRYHPLLHDHTYAHVIANHLNGFLIHKAISGSNNRRIIRTTLHDMLQQRQTNPSQQIIALIGLSFEVRSEIWIDDFAPKEPEESNFQTHVFSNHIDWRKNLLAGRDIGSPNLHKLDPKYFDKYSQGRAYFFSPYAERINLLTDLIMLKHTLDALDVDFLVFQSPRAEKLQEEYLLDFFKQQIRDDERFFDLEEFGFCDWSLSQGFAPMDYHDRPSIGHYGPDAHRAFAEHILIPRLQQLKII